jgi:hypothetical protein
MLCAPPLFDTDPGAVIAISGSPDGAMPVFGLSVSETLPLAEYLGLLPTMPITPADTESLPVTVSAVELLDSSKIPQAVLILEFPVKLIELGSDASSE